MKDTPESIKIKMLSEAGYCRIPLQESYLKLIDFIREIASEICFSSENHYETCLKAQELLKDLGEP